MNTEWFECRDCGERFDFNRATRKKNPEFMVTSGDQWTYGCPSCGSESWNDLDECGCCGSLFADGESPCFGICPKCAEEAKKDTKMLVKFYADKKPLKLEITPLVSGFLTEDEINEILVREFLRRVEIGDEDTMHLFDEMIRDDGYEIAEFMRYEREEAGKAVAS